MKVLVITPACHFKNAGAAQRDTYSAINALQKIGCEVSLFTINSSSQDSAVLDKIAGDYKIQVNKFNPTNCLARRLIRTLSTLPLFDGAAYVFDELVEDKNFLDYLDEFKPDCILSFCSYSWPILKLAKERGIRSVFRSHNFESSFFWESLGVKEKINPLNWLRALAKYFGERNAIKYCDAVGTLPFEQIKKYRDWKEKGVYILTLFFLPESLRPPHVNTGKSILDLFYLGASYNVVFHLRGAEMLIEQIAPKVLAVAKNQICFHICGSKLPQKLIEKCSDGIIYEGYVENLEGFLSKMDAGVFPVKTGKPMKGKVFESLARAFPVVMSKNCLGGYNLIDGSEVLLADNADDFAQKILSLTDLETRSRLADGAYKLGQREFSAEKIETVLKSMLYD